MPKKPSRVRILKPYHDDDDRDPVGYDLFAIDRNCSMEICRSVIRT